MLHQSSFLPVMTIASDVPFFCLPRHEVWFGLRGRAGVRLMKKAKKETTLTIPCTARVSLSAKKRDEMMMMCV